MSENNNVEFTFDYDEAETVDRLISLENTRDMLEQLYKHKFIARKKTSDVEFARDVVTELQQTLLEYAENKGYDTMRWTNHYRKLMCDTFESPLEKEFWRVLTTSLTRIGEQWVGQINATTRDYANSFC